jgi:hypothetical protein
VIILLPKIETVESLAIEQPDGGGRLDRVLLAICDPWQRSQK